MMLFVTACSACLTMCWRQYVPFTASMAKAIASVIEQHPGMAGMSYFAVLLSGVWVVLGSLTLASSMATVANASSEAGPPSAARYAPLVSNFVIIWGTGVIWNVCHVTYAGVFGRWYYGKDRDGALMPSLQVATGPSFGSICMGTGMVAILSTADLATRIAMQDAEEDGNVLLCVVLCIVRCIIDCVRDIAEYFNDWAYVLCALRGVSMCESAQMTCTVLMCARVPSITQDMLLNSLVNMGVLGAGFFTSIVTAVVTGVVKMDTEVAFMGGIVGFFVGLVAGAASTGLINSGGKTILICWADEPDSLMNSHPEVHDRFVGAIQCRE